MEELLEAEGVALSLAPLPIPLVIISGLTKG